MEAVPPEIAPTSKPAKRASWWTPASACGRSRQRLATIGRAPENLTGILVTHEHSDHIQGLVALGGKLRIPVYCNRPTHEAAEFQLGTKLDGRLFATGASFEIGDVLVETFSIPHDAQDPVGYLLRTNGVNIGFLTDLGHVTKLVLDRSGPPTSFCSRPTTT